MKSDHGHLLRIRDIQTRGIIIKDGEYDKLQIDGNNIGKVRVFGVIVSKYNSSENRNFIALTLDDGTDTIRIKAWENQDPEKVILNRYDLLKDVQVGDIIDLVASVRKWEDEIYLDPLSVSTTQDVSLELRRRAQLASIEIEVKGINLKEEEEPEEPWGNESNQDPLTDLILQLFAKENSDLEFDQICQLIKASTTDVNEALNDLISEAYILQVSVGKYRLI